MSKSQHVERLDHLQAKVVRVCFREGLEKTLAQTLVTVHTVRAANARIIATPPADRPASPSPTVAAKIRDVNTSGQYAMQQNYGHEESPPRPR